MEQMMKQFWEAMKGKGKAGGKGKQNKRRKIQPLNPWQRLTLASSNLILNVAKDNRQTKADLMHNAFFTNPYPEFLRDAVEVTTATKGTCRRDAAKATWMALMKGITETKKSVPTEAASVLKKHFANPGRLTDSVLACSAVITYDQSMLKLVWWTRGIDHIDAALQEVVVAVGGEVRYTPAPPYGLERDTSDALKDVMTSLSTGASSSKDWI